MSGTHTTSTASGDHRWKDVEASFTSAVADLNLGIGEIRRRQQVKQFSDRCFAAMSTAADSLSRINDMPSLLQAATHVDQFHQSLQTLRRFPITLSASPEGQVVESNGETVAANLATATEKIAQVEEEATIAWLNHYAKIRPGPDIVPRDSGAQTVRWPSVNNLRVTLRGPAPIDFDSEWALEAMQETGLDKEGLELRATMSFLDLRCRPDQLTVYEKEFFDFDEERH